MPRALLLEPVGRNTAPAACVAALALTEAEPDPLMLVMPSDHTIGDPDAFVAAVDRAAAAARAGALVSFGIAPERAETGYGYIRRGGALDGVEGVFAVAEFVEKPGPEQAQAYVASGEYSWNSGIFLFPARLYLDELERLRPDMVAACRQALATAQRDSDFIRLGKEAFSACAGELDRLCGHGAYAARRRRAGQHGLERCRLVGRLVGDGRQGSATAIRSTATSSPRRPATAICAPRPALVAAIGIEDLVVVATDDAVMVAPRNRTQEVKKLVARLVKDRRDEADALPTVHRPWGSFKSLHNGHRVQVKHILVKPGGKLSLQMHHHRAEHWVVVQGTAKILRGDEEMILTEDQSTYIPIGTAHRLENPGKIPLHLIEVQSGSYLGEDDIVRLEDSYGRS